MFPFQQINDPVFDEINQQDLLVDLHDHVPMDGNIYDHETNKLVDPRKHGDRFLFTNPSSSTTANHHKDDHVTNKKLIHREVEKQRRKQMANLYASLRSLLPLEFIKGTRSTTDQMDQAVNYIRYMQEKIEVLGFKRDQLKNFMGMMSNESLRSLLPNTVVVNSCNGGIEILINSCSTQDGFVLSRMLETLVEEGFDIISCTSTRASQRFLHTIQSEANHDHASIDPSLLQQRLTAIANNR